MGNLNGCLVERNDVNRAILKRFTRWKWQNSMINLRLTLFLLDERWRWRWRGKNIVKIHMEGRRRRKNSSFISRQELYVLIRYENRMKTWNTFLLTLSHSKSRKTSFQCWSYVFTSRFHWHPAYPFAIRVLYSFSLLFMTFRWCYCLRKYMVYHEHV